MFLRLLEIIEHSHYEGWIHTQLNLSNIYVDSRHVTIDGWGYRHLKNQLQTRTTGNNDPWRFCAPESLHGQVCDQRADIFSLTAILRCYFENTTGAKDSRRKQNNDGHSSFTRNLNANPAKRAQNIKYLRQQMPDWPFELIQKNSVKPDRETEDAVLSKTALISWQYEDEEYKLGEAMHSILQRTEWVLECKNQSIAARLFPWANINRGVQPIFRWHETKPMLFIAPGPTQQVDLVNLQQFPYSLLRDLAAMTTALKKIRDRGLAMSGFRIERAFGAYGPELQLSPGPLPQPLNDHNLEKDYRSLLSLISTCFFV